MTCDRNCNKAKCAARACATQSTATTLARALREAYRAVKRGDISFWTINALQIFCEQMPGRVGPQRLLIEALIASGELTRAEKFLGAALLARPNHRRLTLLRCKCLILSCDFDGAIGELHRWLPNRPWDVEAHTLAGEAAAMAGQHELAGGHFAMACAYATKRVSRRTHLARTHIEADKLVDAQQWIIDIGSPAPRLDGLLAARRGELFRASDYFYRAVADAKNSFERQLALVELIQVRQRLGYPHGVRQALELVRPHETLAQSFAAEALVRLGAHREAAHKANRILRKANRHRRAGSIATVASTMCGRTHSAVKSLNRQASQHIENDVTLTSGLWRAGVFEQIVRQQREPVSQHAGEQSLLQPVLKRAATVFGDRLRSGVDALDEATVARLRQQRAECLIALGRPQEAMAGLLRAA